MTSSLRDLDLREFGDWPLPHRAAACGLVLLLSAALPWMLLTRPTLAEQQVLTTAALDIQARLAMVKQRVDASPPLPTHPAAPVLPLPHLPTLLTALHAAAQAAGLRDGQFQPTPSMPTEEDTEIAPSGIELRLSGSWSQLSDFAAALTTPDWDALLGPHDIRLRAHTAAPLLELTAHMRVYPGSAAAPVTAAETHLDHTPRRNPFADTAARAAPIHTPTLVGSIGSGHRQTGLVLSADGQLRRTRQHPEVAR